MEDKGRCKVEKVTFSPFPSLPLPVRRLALCTGRFPGGFAKLDAVTCGGSAGQICNFPAFGKEEAGKKQRKQDDTKLPFLFLFTVFICVFIPV